MDIKLTFCAENVMKSLNEQRNNKQFCDLTVKANNGDTFLVHRNVVCSSSSFFQTLCNTTDKESDVIELSKIPSDVLKKLIEFMYGEKIVPEIEEIRNLLNGALFLKLYNTVDNCTQVLMKTVNKTNKFELLKYAETYINIHGEKLAKECLKFILNDDDFQTIIKSEDFLHLSFDTIKILVSIAQNDSTIKEDNLFLSLIEWISSDIVNREQYVSSLINQIHFDQISNELLLTIYKNYDNFRKNSDFLQKIVEKTLFLNNKTQSLSLQKDGTKKLKLSISSNIYAVFDDEMFMLDPYRKNFFKFIATNIDREYFGYTNFKKEGIFLCGGNINGSNTATNNCKYFSFYTNQFHTLQSMQYYRFNHSAVTLNDQIYVCGDEGGNETSMEIYDLNMDCWQNGCNSNKEYWSFGLCTLGGSIYATTSKYLERFDPRESRWTVLYENDRQCADVFCLAVSYRNFIYKFDELGCKKFDIRQNKWINAIKNVGGNILHACIVDNEIYAVDRKYLFHLNCENDSIIQKYNLTVLNSTRTPYALLFV